MIINPNKCQQQKAILLVFLSFSKVFYAIGLNNSKFQQHSLFCIFSHSDVYIIFQLSQNLNIDYFNMYFDIQNVSRNSCG